MTWPCSPIPRAKFVFPCLAFFSSFLCQCSLCYLWSPFKHHALFFRPAVDGISSLSQFVALIISSLTLREVHTYCGLDGVLQWIASKQKYYLLGCVTPAPGRRLQNAHSDIAHKRPPQQLTISLRAPSIARVTERCARPGHSMDVCSMTWTRKK